MHRKSDASTLVRDCSRDRLADPPCGIRGELESALRVESLCCPYQTKGALLDQVEQIKVGSPHVAPRDRHDKSQVRINEMPQGFGPISLDAMDLYISVAFGMLESGAEACLDPPAKSDFL